ncbi:MAG: methyltransferase type 11, partial [Deltaproteobacteria bacterium]|nr:methyltransferase type 11 [Deltaproteobacteria bacterium]
RRGGRVAIAFWSSKLLLPGHPELEARLDLALAEHLPYLRVAPERQHQRALGWLQARDLEDCTARTFVADVIAPLSPALRESVSAALRMLLDEVRSVLDVEERDRFERLCDPGSAEFLAALPDYSGFVTYSMFCGNKPRRTT